MNSYSKGNIHDERPRERLERLGPEALSNIELLAILLRIGTKGMNCTEIAQSLLTEYSSLSNLSKAHVAELQSFQGVGLAKACSLVAALELGKRVTQEESAKSNTLESHFALWQSRLCDMEREFIVSIYMDSQGFVIGDDRISYGGPLGAALDLPYLLRRAVRLDCKWLALLHNHPNKSSVVSNDDIELTRSLYQKLTILGIGLHSHHIVAGNAMVKVDISEMSLRRKK